jgi:LAS superfamily LD-carboxypeptidase LdcB
VKSLGALSPFLRRDAQQFVHDLEDAGLHPRITSTRRTRREQTRLYRRFLRGLQPFPVAPPGYSEHERGLALDLVCDDNDAAGAEWERRGHHWGGSADPVHFGV